MAKPRCRMKSQKLPARRRSISIWGAEIDLVLELPPKQRWAIELKRSSAPTLARGYYIGCDDVKATRRLVVHTGDESFALGEGVEAVTLADAVKALGSA